MNLKELSTPLIVYWDLPSVPVTPHIIQRICEDLFTNRVFVLNLWDSSPDICEETSIILKRLGNKNINVTLTVDYSALNILDPKNFLPTLKKILIQAESLEQLASIIDKIQFKKTEIPPVGISFIISEPAFKDIPDVLRLCLKAGINNIHFPIQRMTEDQKIFWLDTENNHWLLEEIKNLQVNALNVTIHDPFLWKIFNKGINQDEKGCQGGNTMVYISGNLDVTPCPMLPIVFGNLRSTTLTDIFLSHERQQIRRRLSTPPQECGDCAELNECGGGCRGRAYLIHKTFDKRDPACHRS
jgi:GeoRSP system SPASM domain protein